jgi:hypothetical protein
MVASRPVGRRHQRGIRTAPQPIADVLAAAIGNGLPVDSRLILPDRSPDSAISRCEPRRGAGDIRSVLVIIGDDPHVSGMAGLVAAVRQDARCASAPDRFTAKGISFRCQQPSEIAMETVQPAVRQTYREVAQSYRDLASRCRDMAKRDRRPASLLLRAAALEATAEYVERPGAQSA